MAQVANPHKKFLFSISIFGMNPFRAQKVTLPDREVDVVKHGEGNHYIKTGGMVEIGTLNCDNIFSASLPNRLFWDWILIIQETITGGGLTPDVYKKAAQVDFLKNDGVTIQNSYSFLGIWPSKINGIELDRVSSENTIESVEFQVDHEVKL